MPFNTQVKIAQGTALTYVDYGAESMSEGCKNISGTICTAAWDVYDKICNGLTDQTACRATSKRAGPMSPLPPPTAVISLR